MGTLISGKRRSPKIARSCDRRMLQSSDYRLILQVTNNQLKERKRKNEVQVLTYVSYHYKSRLR